MMGIFGDIIKWIVIAIVIIAFIYLAVAALVAFGVVTAAEATLWLGFGLLTFSSALGLVAVGVLGLALAFLIDPAVAQATVDKITAGLSNAGSAIVSGVGNIITGTAGAVLGSNFGTYLLAGAALLGFYYIRKNKNEKVERVYTSPRVAVPSLNKEGFSNA
jgi:uncharacterized membrane protein